MSEGSIILASLCMRGTGLEDFIAGVMMGVGCGHDIHREHSEGLMLSGNRAVTGNEPTGKI